MSAGRQPVFIYGAGGHGKVVADILLGAMNFEVRGFVDDLIPPGPRKILGLDVLGDVHWLFSGENSGPVALALGIGDNFQRRTLAEKCLGLGATLVIAIHPRAAMAPSATIAEGSVVMAGVVVNPDARVGRGAILNSGAIVEHDCVIGDFAHLSPGVALGGGVKIGELTHIGIGASILPGISIGAGCTVGAGSVVLRDIPDHAVAYGVPASLRGTLKQPGNE